MIYSDGIAEVSGDRSNACPKGTDWVEFNSRQRPLPRD